VVGKHRRGAGSVLIRIRSVAETASTNDDMAALARAGEPEGSWLRADSQTSGRGRLGRRWQPVPGNLYASTLVRVSRSDPPAATLALVASLALDQVVSAYLPRDRVMLKWPNDVLVDGAKLSGILLEAESDAIVIGIGVNLAGHPEDTGRRTTSLAAEGAAAPAPDAFLEDLAASFASWVHRWRQDGLASIIARWLDRAHPRGAALFVGGGEAPVSGLFEGLEADGALRLRLADGRVRVIHAADVSLL
jgi:BirA family biotin operon repressor/biotin-[acetyl-CoA-carboxylase] ligase